MKRIFATMREEAAFVVAVVLGFWADSPLSPLAVAAFGLGFVVESAAQLSQRRKVHTISIAVVGGTVGALAASAYAADLTFELGPSLVFDHRVHLAIAAGLSGFVLAACMGWLLKSVGVGRSRGTEA